MDKSFLKLFLGDPSASIVATENYWGTLNTIEIDSMIYDRKDDITCVGFIKYLSIVGEPHPAGRGQNVDPGSLVVSGITHYHVSGDTGASVGPEYDRAGVERGIVEPGLLSPGNRLDHGIARLVLKESRIDHVLEQ